MHEMEYYLFIKSNEILAHVTEWKNPSSGRTGRKTIE
jgi:hypothetical protein